MSIGNLPMVEFERLPWYESPFFTLGLLAACLIIFLTTLFGWPIAALVNRRRGRPAAPAPRLARWIAGIASFSGLLFVIGFAILLLFAGNFGFGISRANVLMGVLTLGLACAGFTLGALGFSVVSWKQRYWGLAGRLHYTLVVLAGAAFVWFLYTWNLLGYHL
jgi:hypothetical protein